MSRKKKRRVLRGAKLAAIIAPTPIVYLFSERFTITRAAPLPDPLPASHVGEWDVRDTGSHLSVANGVLVFADRVGSTDPRITTQSFARTAGLALFLRYLMPAAGVAAGRPGWDNVSSGGIDYSAFRINTNGVLDVSLAATLIAVASGLDDDVLYDLAAVMRASGMFYFAKGGSEFPTWTLLFIDDALSATPLWAGVTSGGAGRTIDVDDAHVTQLSGVFQDDFGWVTDRLAGARAPGDTFNHTADCLIEFTVTTLPSAGQIELRFRIQDASNYWQGTIDSTGALDLDEVVAGVPTQRGTAAGVIGAGERIQIRAIDEEIRVWDAAALRINYGSAANFKTETAGELDTEGTAGAVDDIVAWPTNSHNFNKYLRGA